MKAGNSTHLKYLYFRTTYVSGVPLISHLQQLADAQAYESAPSVMNMFPARERKR